jgi:hypothetical protein
VLRVDVKAAWEQKGGAAAGRPPIVGSSLHCWEVHHCIGLSSPPNRAADSYLQESPLYQLVGDSFDYFLMAV